jgi:hypothetical protein
VRASRLIRSVWAACLLIGGVNHARILLQHGLFWDYGGINFLSAVYWSSLTVLDPLIAALLFVWPRIGIPAAVVLIVTNVAHNLAVTAYSAAPDDLLSLIVSNPFLLSQFAFMVFVVITARTAWSGLERNQRPFKR